MDTRERSNDAENLLERMRKISDDLWSGYKPNNFMTTDGELKQWQRDIMNDPVNHPSHYTDGKIEVIDFIEDKKLGFHLGNAVKYIARAGKKDPAKTVEDLEKAIWYIKRYIEEYKQQDGLNIRNGYFVTMASSGDTDGDTTISTMNGGKDND